MYKLPISTVKGSEVDCIREGVKKLDFLGDTSLIPSPSSHSGDKKIEKSTFFSFFKNISLEP